MGAPKTLPADFNGWDSGPPTTLPPDFNQWDDSKPAKPASGTLSEGGFGFQASNPSSIPNARIRNYANPAQNETSAAGAFYHGAKTGLMMGSLPFAADVTIPQAVGGLVGGTVAGVGAQQIAKTAGAGELGQEVSGDVGGLVGGLVGAGVSESAANALARVYKSLPDSARSELLGVLSPRAAHALRLAKLGSKVLDAATEKPSLIPPEAPSPEMLQSKALATPGHAPVPEQAAALETIPVSAKSTSQAIKELGPKAPIQSIKARAAEIQQAANEAVGYKPPEPGKPIAQRPANMPTAASRAASDAAFQKNYPAETMPEGMTPQEKEIWQEKVFGEKPTGDIGSKVRQANPEPTRAETKGIPEGHTAVESSAMKSYKYDPKAQEFEVTTPGGQHYVYGDVSPDQASAFEAAESKGKAWNELRQNSTLVAKVVKGKRIPVPRTMNEMDKIPEDEWQAGHELETGVEGTPRH